MRSSRVLGLAAVLLAGSLATARAEWKSVLFPEGQTLPKVDDASEFLNNFIGAFGPGDRPIGSVVALNLFTMPGSFITRRGNFISLGSFDLDGVTVHQYYERQNTGATNVEAISMQDRSADWLLCVVRAWAACGNEGFGTGASLMVRAFAAKVAKEESASVAKKAVAKFMAGLSGLKNIGYEGEAQTKVDAFRAAVANLDTDTLMDWTDESEADELAKRGLRLVQEQGISSALGQ